MQSQKTQSTVSRRGWLRGAAGVAGAALAGNRLFGQQGVLAYVGTYTPNGQGIYLFRVDTSNGRLTPVKIFPSTVNPSWLAFHPNKKYLYAANEISNFNGTTAGSVSAYSVNAANGDLTLLNTVSSQGAGPAHLGVDPGGDYVTVANYGGGNIAVLPILLDGSLGNATDMKNDADACTPGPCTLGPTQAQKAPPGSFARSGHEAPHAHMAETDPEGDFVIVNDLGLDRTIVWKLDRAAGKLSEPKTVPSSPGAGPRHFAFHRNGRWFYSLNEESSTLAFMSYDARTGTLAPISEISTLPAGFVGTNYTSEVMVSRNGRYIYAAYRLHDTIAIFEIESTGAPRLIGEQWTRGDYPRSFGIEPTNNFMYVCNHRGDAVATFRITEEGRRLTFTGQYTPVGSPAVIVFL